MRAPHRCIIEAQYLTIPMFESLLFAILHAIATSSLAFPATLLLRESVSKVLSLDYKLPRKEGA